MCTTPDRQHSLCHQTDIQSPLSYFQKETSSLSKEAHYLGPDLPGGKDCVVIVIDAIPADEMDAS